MAGDRIPPLELAPPLPRHLTPQQRIELWVDLMNACEQFLLAGLRWQHVRATRDMVWDEALPGDGTLRCAGAR